MQLLVSLRDDHAARATMRIVENTIEVALRKVEPIGIHRRRTSVDSIHVRFVMNIHLETIRDVSVSTK